MRFCSFNVNGLRAILKKEGFESDMQLLDADIICFGETKLSDNQFSYQPEGYQIYHTISKVKKGYSGVAVLTRIAPLSVKYGLLDGKYDEEGRAVTLEFADFYFVGLYVPNSGAELERLAFRLQFQKDLEDYLNFLQQTKPVITAGDMNVAPEEIDLKNPKTNHFSAGFTDEEREAHRHLLKVTNTFDAYRTLYPEKVEYTWWSYRFQSRAKNIGWRIDHYLLSNSLRERVSDCIIRGDIKGSDHCPIILELK